ncbi:MAG: PTS mannose transporter subunit IIA [Pseudomonadota bacterium]|nr:PTS mannose transporter subunit IIA [Pseudomonadota bacterium]
MSVGILLVTHDDIGTSLVDSLQKILGNLPLPIKVLPVRHSQEPLAYCYHAENLYLTLNQGQGVLVLTDLFGATPCNIACSLVNNYRVRIVCGVNLPMLVKLMNYPSADLDTLANKALSGGCQGILDVNSVLNTI